jgi:NADPH:quinone reductase-like Zn-dependent oxidoreductase
MSNAVLAHDPVYPGVHAPDLVPCADGAGEISAVSSEGSKWKVGQRVVISVIGWQKWTYGNKPENAVVVGMSAKGSSSSQGTLREYAVLVYTSPLLPFFLLFNKDLLIPNSLITN